MPHLVVAAYRRRSCGEGKGALYRETLQATGCYVGRIVIATAEFAPMPPLHLPGYPGGLFRRPSGCVFGGMTESIGPMWFNTKPKNQTPGTGPTASRRSAPQPG